MIELSGIAHDLDDDSLYLDKSGQIHTVEEAAQLYGPECLGNLPGHWVRWDDSPTSEYAQLYRLYLHDRSL